MDENGHYLYEQARLANRTAVLYRFDADQVVRLRTYHPDRIAEFDQRIAQMTAELEARARIADTLAGLAGVERAAFDEDIRAVLEARRAELAFYGAQVRAALELIEEWNEDHRAENARDSAD
jgi:hypothetical protein